jgi:DNA-binding MarR family transcriptional regulator
MLGSVPRGTFSSPAAKCLDTYTTRACPAGRQNRRETAVPRSPRSQRKRIVKMPDWMLESTARQFPGFDQNATAAMFALRSIARRFSDCTDEILAELGLNAAQYNYLTVLFMAPERQLTSGELSTLIHTSNATVTSMVGALERDGLVRRVAAKDDRRSVMVRLTAKGSKLIERAMPVRIAMVAKVFEELADAEREQLVALLLKLGSGLDRHFGPA